MLVLLTAHRTLTEQIITGALNVTGVVTLDTSLTLAAGATITEFATSTSLGTSDTKVPTQNAVKGLCGCTECITGHHFRR
jgi:hypothetical protein